MCVRVTQKLCAGLESCFIWDTRLPDQGVLFSGLWKPRLQLGVAVLLTAPLFGEASQQLSPFPTSSSSVFLLFELDSGSTGSYIDNTAVYNPADAIIPC